MMVFLSQII